MSTHPIRLYLAAEARRLRDALVPPRRGPLRQVSPEQIDAALKRIAEDAQRGAVPDPVRCERCGRAEGEPPRSGRVPFHGCPAAPPRRGGPPPGTRVPTNPASATRWTK